jgi:Beta protein
VRFDNCHYVPCLRWKQGEYQALLRLTDESKCSLTPLIEVPEIGYDFEAGKPSKTLDDHLAPFATRVDAKWRSRSCFVDLVLIDRHQRMADGTHPVRFVHDQLRAKACSAVPVFGFDRDADFRRAVQDVVAQDGRGLCLRVSLEEAARGIRPDVEEVLQQTELSPEDVDLVLDLGSPNFVPIDGFAKLLTSVVGHIPRLKGWRTFSIIGTSFPPSMAEVKSSPETLPRSEWLVYRRLCAELASEGMRLPTFGDYGISHPDLLDLDMRLVKPSASIRYTINDAWHVIKGPNVRDHGYSQYRGHCLDLVSCAVFMGSDFSWGDNYIAECAVGKASTGNLTTWRAVGTNHHLEKVVADIASLSAP